ncbi:hypothetical protein [Deinococcus rhizophilus]|uniref:hypothetical protein n=1 Tax=Deinococcus rhizophilus TaxID=3049544 RepID=UPI002DD68266|nr:hypothetical protein [Deinococcus rhizophilus]
MGARHDGSLSPRGNTPYLTSCRFVGIYLEHATRRVLADLVWLLDPERLTATCDYGVRGGIHTMVTAHYVTPDAS